MTLSAADYHVSKTKHRFPWEPQRLTTPHRLTLLKTFCHISVACVAVCTMACMYVELSGQHVAVSSPSRWVPGTELGALNC